MLLILNRERKNKMYYTREFMNYVRNQLSSCYVQWFVVKTKQKKRKQYKTKQNKTKQNKTKQNKTCSKTRCCPRAITRSTRITQDAVFFLFIIFIGGRYDEIFSPKKYIFYILFPPVRKETLCPTVQSK